MASIVTPSRTKKSDKPLCATPVWFPFSYHTILELAAVDSQGQDGQIAHFVCRGSQNTLSSARRKKKLVPYNNQVGQRTGGPGRRADTCSKKYIAPRSLHICLPYEIYTTALADEKKLQSPPSLTINDAPAPIKSQHGDNLARTYHARQAALDMLRRGARSRLTWCAGGPCHTRRTGRISIIEKTFLLVRAAKACLAGWRKGISSSNTKTLVLCKGRDRKAVGFSGKPTQPYEEHARKAPSAFCQSPNKDTLSYACIRKPGQMMWSKRFRSLFKGPVVFPPVCRL